MSKTIRPQVNGLKKFLKDNNCELVTIMDDGKVLICLHELGSGDCAGSVKWGDRTTLTYFNPNE